MKFGVRSMDFLTSYILPLFQAQQAFYKIEVGFGNYAIFSQMTLALSTFLCKNVAFERTLMRNFSSAGHFEALFGAGICFNLRHFKMRFE